MKIKELTLKTEDLSLVKSFYSDILKLKTENREKTVLVETAETHFNFKHSNKAVAPYHFAFNVDKGFLDVAYKKLKQKIKILSYQDDEVIHFNSWNARSIYFYDPAGNILELIEREESRAENLKSNELGIFSVSEIGISSFRIKRMLDQFLTIDLPFYSGDGENFSALGNPNGLIILVNARNKTWMPTEIKASPEDCSITLENKNHIYHIWYRNDDLKIEKVS